MVRRPLEKKIANNKAAPQIFVGNICFMFYPEACLLGSKSVSLIELRRLPVFVSRRGGQSQEEAPLQVGPEHCSQKLSRSAPPA